MHAKRLLLRAGRNWACMQTFEELCPTLCDPMDCSPPGSSIHGIPQARTLEWIAISSSKGSSWPRDRTHVSCISCTGRWRLHQWAIWEPDGCWPSGKNSSKVATELVRPQGCQIFWFLQQIWIFMSNFTMLNITINLLKKGLLKKTLRGLRKKPSQARSQVPTPDPYSHQVLLALNEWSCKNRVSCDVQEKMPISRNKT